MFAAIDANDTGRIEQANTKSASLFIQLKQSVNENKPYYLFGEDGKFVVQAGCTSSQYILASTDFMAQNETWEIRLRSTHSQSATCFNRVWASLVLKSGNNPNLYNSSDIQVYTTFQYDILPSSHFGSGAYTNMLLFSNNFACAQYNGNGISPPPACFSN